jgi:PST family polysaccharide transporter
MLLASAGQQLLSFVIFTILARLLTDEAFGLVALAIVYVTFLQRFVDQGLTDAIIQRERLEDDHLQSAFWMSNLFAAALAGMSVVLARPIATLFGDARLAPVIQALALMFPLNSLSGVPRAILRKEMHFRALTFRTLIAVLLGGVVGIVMAATGWGVWALVGQLLARQLASVLTLWSSVSWKPRWRFSRRHLGDLFSFGIHVLGSNLMVFLIGRFDRLVIGFFLGFASVGQYFLATRIPELFNELSAGTVQQVIYPTVSRIQQDRTRVQKAYLGALRMASLAVFPLFLTYIAVAPQVVEVAFGPQWAPAVPVTRVLALGVMTSGLLQYNISIMMALGKSSWRFGLTALSAGLSVILSLVAVQFGLIWVAVAVVANVYLLAPLQFFMMRNLIGITAAGFWQSIRAPLASGMLSAVTAWLLVRTLLPYLPAWLVLFLGLFVSAAVFLPTMMLIGRPTLMEAWATLRAALQRGGLAGHEENMART